VNDVRTLAAKQRQELQKAEHVAPEAERAPDLHKWDETDARLSRGVAEWPRSVGRYDHLETIGEWGEKGSDVRLRPTGLGQRHEEHDSWTHGRTVSR
jgi:hypothetical protein